MDIEQPGPGEADAELMKIIYDVGTHKGEDLEYYLMKADKVVSIDANPYVFDDLRKNFRQQLASGRVTFIHCAVTDSSGKTNFCVNRKESALSRRRILAEEIARFGDLCSEDAWEPVTVPASRLSDIIRDQGDPYFIKIDIEGGEENVIADLYKNEIRPPYISTELGAGYFDSLCYLYLMGYREFQAVRMDTVQQQFGHQTITLSDGNRTYYDFLRGSSGPFGEDLPDWWVDLKRLWFFVATRSLIFGESPWDWYDIHARLA